MNTYSKAPWTYDNAGVISAADGKIIADVKWDLEMSLNEGNANLKLMAAAPEMEHALRSFIAGMENKEEQFPGHNMAYLISVCLPRAKNALKKATV